jgi:hypothetical protein
MSYYGLTDRIAATNRRLDLIADVRFEEARRDAKAMRRADALDEEERRTQARKDRSRCRDHQGRYDEAFGKHGARAPQPAADERPPGYRRRLYAIGQSMLPSGHALTKFDAEDIDGSAIPELERQLLEALDKESETPTGDNRPDSVDDPRARREKVDAMGLKTVEYHAKRSFIADLNRAGRKVRRLIDPRDGRVLIGENWSRPPG